MSEITRIILKNMAPLHIGKGTDYYDFSSPDLQSDTLSSALAVLRAESGKTEDIESFLQSFTISSAFPYSGGHYFLPKLQGRLNVQVKGEDKYVYRKSLKEIRYIEESLWFQLAEGRKVEIEKKQIHRNFLLNEASDDFSQPVKANVMQRVSVPRNDEDQATPFFFEWNYLNKNAGLYCLLQADSEVKKDIISLFRSLGEVGIGSDKSVGGGCFTVESETIEYNEIADADSTAILSLYIPTEVELSRISLPESRYELLLRGGFIAGSTEEAYRHLLKKSVYMLNTGSVFPVKEHLLGKVVDLKPNWNDGAMHPVYRSGRPFCLFVKNR